MIKKYLAVMALGTATIGMAGADTPSTSSMAPMSARSTSAFIQGFSAGINAGYQSNKLKSPVSTAFADIKFNSPAIGVHADYNHLVSNPVFIGAGLDINYNVKQTKKVVNVTDSSGLSGNVSMRIRKGLSGAFTLRVGVVSGPVAFDVNGAVLLSSFKASFNTPVAGISDSQTRTGFAPGVGLTFCVAKNLTAGINYRYEIYPKKGKNGTKPRMESHNVFAKLSYNLSK